MSSNSNALNVDGNNENYPCVKCKLTCNNTDCIMCDSCEKWMHFKCTKLPKRKLMKLITGNTNSDDPFFCTSCYFPCPKCKKSCQNSNCICCDICNHWYHQDCAKLSKNQFRGLNRSNKAYYCTSCIGCAFPFSHLSDDQLISECVGSVSLKNESDTNGNKIFNSADTVTNNNKIFNCDIVYENVDENDQDNCSNTALNKKLEFGTKIDCEYLDTNDLGGLMNSKGKYLSVFHANVRSLNKNKDNLTDLFANCQTFPDIIAISETKINNTTNIESLQIPGYTFSYNNSSTQAGGVGLYTCNEMQCKIRDDLHMKVNGCENIWAEISTKSSNGSDTNKKKLKKNEILIFGLVYRHSYLNLDEFNERWFEQLTILAQKNIKYIVAGDLNIDLMTSVQNSRIFSYLNSVVSLGCSIHLNRPTRVVDKTATLIDHVYSNFSDENVETKIIMSEISPNDHFSTITFFSHYSSCPKKKKKIFVRKKNLNEQEWSNFNRKLHSLLENDTYYNIVDVNEKVNFITQCYNDLIEEFMPLRQLSRKETRFYYRPWITAGLKTSIAQKNKLFSKMKKNETDTNVKEFKTFRNKLSKLLSIAEKKYHHKKLFDAKNDKKQTWKVLNNIKNGKHKTDRKSKCNINQLVDEHGVTVESATSKANMLNKFFNEIGSKLSDRFLDEGDALQYINHNVSDSLLYFETACSEAEVAKLIDNLSVNKTTGPDHIPVTVIKATKRVIVPILNKLFNECLGTGIFPDAFKTSNIIALFKAGNRCLPNNYRPISLLPHFGKFLERILYNRLINFFKKNNLLCSNQFGFRKNFLTILAIADIYDEILESLDNNLNICTVFLDLKKAFDTINHDILIKKMERYGIKGLALQIFKSYFKNRKHLVKLDDSSSDWLILKIGVPQGSVLGPLLFLIFINDLPSCTKMLTRLFADDTFLLYKHKNLKKLQKIVNSEMKNISLWLKANKLSLNIAKSKFMLISNQKSLKRKKFKLSIDRKKLEQTASYKYLGVYIDNKLNWKPQIQHLCSKLSKVCSVISKLRYYVNLTLLTLEMFINTTQEEAVLIIFTVLYLKLKVGKKRSNL